MNLTLLVVGIAVAFNLLVIKVKYDKARYADALLDLSLLVLITVFFNGSFNALVTGTIASAIISIYLFFSPTKMPNIFTKEN